MTGSHIPPGDNTLAIVNLGRVSEGLTVCGKSMTSMEESGHGRRTKALPYALQLTTWLWLVRILRRRMMSSSPTA
eukprot:scaffold3171_cov380-Prasinococcus_capsulatus_cf.AAC.2